MGGADGDESRDCEEIEFTLRHTCVSESTEDITTNDLIPDARFPDVLPISAPPAPPACARAPAKASRALEPRDRARPHTAVLDCTAARALA